MKILITGGHLSPALAIIEEFGNQADIVFVGRKYDLAGKKNYSLEYQEISNKNIPFYDLQTGRFTRLFNLNFFLNFFKMPYGFYQSVAILRKEKPSVIISFGGYLGFPVCLMGFILGIPLFIHEQTLKPGLTNRLTAFLAKKIFVSFPETKVFFPEAKVLITGNPVKKSILAIIKKPFEIKKTKPVIYITGGSLGSRSINDKIEVILPELLSKYIIVHQTGNGKEKGIVNKDYYSKKHFFADELGYIYSISDLVISRAGANTIFELIAWKKPSILIPLPWSANREQSHQAGLLQNFGVAKCFEQKNTAGDLFRLIEEVLSGLQVYKNNFKKVKLPYQENASKIITRQILDSLTR